MKKLLFILLIVLMVVASVACTGDTTPTTSQSGEVSVSADAQNNGSSASANGSMKVGLCIKSLNHAFFAEVIAGAEEAAANLGIELIVDGTTDESDSEGMAAVIENFLAQDCKVIATTISDDSALSSTIKKCNDAGVPFITIDSLCNPESLEEAGAHVTTFIGTDNYYGGQLVGEYCAELFADATEEVQLGLITGLPGTEVAYNRQYGFEDAIEAANNPNLNLVYSQPGDWEIELGMAVAENMFQAWPDIQFVFGCNDYMALGCLQAAQSAGIDDVIIVGYDGIEDAMNSVMDGGLAASLGQYPYKMGVWSVQVAYALMNGLTEADIPDTLFAGCYVVTKDLMDDYDVEYHNFEIFDDVAKDIFADTPYAD